jgi:hypothetical protein
VHYAWNSQPTNHLCVLSTSHKVTKSTVLDSYVGGFSTALPSSANQIKSAAASAPSTILPNILYSSWQSNRCGPTFVTQGVRLLHRSTFLCLHLPTYCTTSTVTVAVALTPFVNTMLYDPGHETRLPLSATSSSCAVDTVNKTCRVSPA